LKTIGLLGGMSWESSLNYYKIINRYTNELLGGQNNAKSILYTLNFEEIEKLQYEGNWDEASKLLEEGAISLKKAGADFILICTNTMHKLLPKIKSRVDIEFLHIAKATADEIKKEKIKKVGLLGTKFTMSEDFYKGILKEEGLEVAVPNEEDMDVVHKIIYEELCLGKVKSCSKMRFLEIIDRLEDIEGVILGCTEIGMLISQKDLEIKVFDTTSIHAKEAVKMALEVKE